MSSKPSDSKKSIKVSVVVPVYNTASWLAQCLESICTQTLNNIEIICINDGSLDNSQEILDFYQRKDKRIIIINQENKGLSEARNEGVRVASGEYLYFLDSDDYIEADTLDVLAKDMDKRKLQFVCFNTTAFGDDSDNIRLAKFKNETYYHRILDEKEVFTGWALFQQLKLNSIYLAPVWLNMIKRDHFINNGLWFRPGIVHEDESWMFSAMLCSSRCGCYNKSFHHRRYRENSIMTNTMSFESVYGYFCSIADIQEAVKIYSVNDKILKIVIDHLQSLQNLAIFQYRQCDAKEQEKYFLLPPETQIMFHQIIIFPSMSETAFANLQEKYFQAEIYHDTDKRELDWMKHSIAWKIGRSLTLVPRIIRSAISKVKNGLHYLRNRRTIRKNRIVLQLRSRLGNQMFIYVLFLKLKALGKNVVIDDVSRLRDGQNGYHPDLLSEAFHISYPKATDDEINTLQDLGNHRSDFLIRKFWGPRPIILQEVDDYTFDNRVLEWNSGYFTGWFQNIHYFEGIEEVIRNNFRFNPILSENEKAKKMEEQILGTSFAVSLHLRFGDYLNSVNLPKYGGFCTDKYYSSALNILQQRLENGQITVFVFSDDPKLAYSWVEKQKTGGNSLSMIVVDVCSNRDSWIDMYLMSLCHHNIIANSSFSWWAAWLNSYPNKIVVSPAYWYRNSEKLYRGIQLENAVNITSQGNIVD